MKKNILFSTTRQWNPGDEFILMGCQNILKNIFGDYNSIIYNRNPEVRQNWQYINPFRKLKYGNLEFIKGKEILDSFLRNNFWDNSFKDTTSGDFIDLVVFAGSPEWITKRSLQLYNTICKYNIPTIYLGIGSSSEYNLNRIPQIMKQVLGNALFISVRDERTLNLLEINNYKAQYNPCPAILSVDKSKEKNIKTLKKIGLIYGTYKAVSANNIKKETYYYLINLYRHLIRKYKNVYEFEFVCHYIDELPEVKKDFPEFNINYSFNSSDYIDIFSKFDLVIGHRVHAIGMSASLGIPGICISHDMRGATCIGFKAPLIKVGDSFDICENLINEAKHNIFEQNLSIIKHKNLVMAKYLNTLNNLFKN